MVPENLGIVYSIQNGEMNYYVSEQDYIPPLLQALGNPPARHTPEIHECLKSASDYKYLLQLRHRVAVR